MPVDVSLYREVYQNHLRNVNPSAAFMTKPSSDGVWLCLWAKDRKRLPGFFQTHELDLGAPHVLKYLRKVEVYGKGEARIRLVVDGVVVVNGIVVASDHYTPARTIAFPRGTTGRTLAIEVSGLSEIDFYDVDWEPVGA